MTIIPAIDVIDGCCVRLTKGDYATAKTYYKDPLDAARNFEDHGIQRLHIVDLDGAKSAEPKNLRVLERVATRTNLEIQYGGGIKTAEALHSVFDAGAAHAICGSVAVRNRDLFAEWLDAFGSDRLILGADTRHGKVSVQGWTEDVPLTVEDLIEGFLPHGLSRTIVTDITKDGMLCGIDTAFYSELQQRFPSVEITVSGGISGMADLDAIAAADLRSVIVGKAIYEGKIDLKELTAFNH